MKKIIYLLLFIQSTSWVHGQGIGIGTTQPKPGAALDIESTTKGILLPRLTNSQMLAIQGPSNSLLVYNTDTNSFWYYTTADGWKNLSFALPFNETIFMNSPALSIVNNNSTTLGTTFYASAASGNAIYGVSGSTYPGVQGYNTGSGIAVRGENSGSGHGVHARGKNLTGLYADIPTGTGTAAKFVNNNANGLALDIEGKWSITGGNTNPTYGHVLTSLDVAGNAMWKASPATHQRVAFEARGMAGNGANVMYGNLTSYKYHPGSIIYNPGGDFKTIAQSPSSTFIVPKGGLYELKAMITFPYTTSSSMSITIMVQRNGVSFDLAYENENFGAGTVSQIFLLSKISVSTSVTAKLLPGDRVWLELSYNKEASTTSAFDTGNEYHYFSGTMLWED